MNLIKIQISRINIFYRKRKKKKRKSKEKVNYYFCDIYIGV